MGGPSATESSQPRVIRMINAPRRKACEEQAWPYIDSGCLAAIAEKKRVEAAIAEAGKRPRVSTAALRLPSAAGAAARRSGPSETDGSSGARASSETEIRQPKAGKISRDSKRRSDRHRRGR